MNSNCSSYIDHRLLKSRKYILESSNYYEDEDNISTKELNRISNILNNTLDAEKAKKSDIDKLVDKYNYLIISSGINGEYYASILSIIEKLCSLGYYKDAAKIVNNYCKFVLPKSTNIELLKNRILNYNISNELKENICHVIDDIIIVDRVFNNHRKLSEDDKNNIISILDDRRYSNRLSIIKICNFINQYDLPNSDKYVIAVEEILYYFTVLNSYSKDVVEFAINEVITFFLFKDIYLNDEDIDKYRKIITSDIKYDFSQGIYDRFNILNRDNINSTINDTCLLPNKYIDDIIEKFKNDIANYTYDDIDYNKQKLIDFVLDIIMIVKVLDDSRVESYVHLFEYTVKLLCNNIIGDIELANKESINYCKDFVNSLSDILTNLNFEYIIDHFEDIIDDIENELDDLPVYYKNNVETIDSLNTDDEYNDPISIDEFKIFKFHNLVRAAFNLNKFLKNKEKVAHTKRKIKRKSTIKKIKSVLFAESMDGVDIYSYIGEDKKADICVGQFEINSNDDKNEFEEFANETCMEFNKKFTNDYSTIRSYYIINTNIGEIHIKENTPIELSDDDYEQMSVAEKYDMNVYIDNFCEAVLNTFKLEKTVPAIHEYLNNINDLALTTEHFNLIMECFKYLNFDKNDIEKLSEKAESYFNTTINESYECKKNINKVKSYSDNWSRFDDVPVNIQIEAVELLYTVLEDADKTKIHKPNVNINDAIDNKGKSYDSKSVKADFKDIKSDKFSKDRLRNRKVSKLDNVKLQLMGLKDKARNFSQKEREASNNMDGAFNYFSNSLKKAMVSDNREAIIKGKVLPSFSKCIKIGIVLTGLGLATGTIITPIIGALGAFAVSKHLTKKERMLILDEIDTELEVIEKEISQAESNNEYKKLRKLLNTKKDLQRQYQRIRYNVKAGKDINIPVTAGMRNKDDD